MTTSPPPSVPNSLLSATERAKIGETDLPVGGAPPVEIPPFAQKSWPGLSKAAQDQLPQQPKRTPEQIQADLAAAMKIMEHGGPLPGASPEAAVPIQDATSPAWAQPAAPSPAQPPQPPPEPVPQIVTDTVTAKTVTSTASDDEEFPSLTGALEELRAEFDFQRRDVKEAVLGRMGEVDLTEVLTKESVVQRVSIIPGHLDVEFRTLTAVEDLEIKERLYSLSGSTRYVMDNYILLSLACGLQSYNDARFLQHIVYDSGRAEINKTTLDQRFEAIKRLPMPTLALLSCVYGWFDARIRTAMIDGVLGK